MHIESVLNVHLFGHEHRLFIFVFEQFRLYKFEPEVYAFVVQALLRLQQIKLMFRNIDLLVDQFERWVYNRAVNLKVIFLRLEYGDFIFDFHLGEGRLGCIV